ncbi:DUF4194 domain-containing protein [Roseospira visakhapatnamensis]|uniref:DUF4194 domain-containing protein n=1 Tax=Roseospira visakhapatnamensis TaxID=390880 RepID=A0A7W6W9F9_9PROT|nr:DUF4194 domain-containing protein [Roseospira visakhapatnamensis]MBB4265412.1 hypothetical protein [Roseospira visakhapatnamensis]
MLPDLERLDQATGGKAAEDISAALRLLLNRQFLFSGDRGVAKAYDVLTNSRYRSFIEDWVDVLGLEFVLHQREQWVGLLPKAEISHIPSMNLADTLVLLVVGQAWQEAANRGDFSGDRAEVQTTVNRVWDLYDTLRSGLTGTSMAIGEFQRALKELDRRNLILLGEMDGEMEDQDLRIRPMVTHLLRDGEALRILEDYARSERGLMNLRGTRDERSRGPDATSDAEGGTDGEEAP